MLHMPLNGEGTNWKLPLFKGCPFLATIRQVAQGAHSTAGQGVAAEPWWWTTIWYMYIYIYYCTYIYIYIYMMLLNDCAMWPISMPVFPSSETLIFPNSSGVMPRCFPSGSLSNFPIWWLMVSRFKSRWTHDFHWLKGTDNVPNMVIFF